MSNSKKAKLSNWDSREYLTVAEATALWAEREPLLGHQFYPDLSYLKRRLQEVLLILGHNSKHVSASHPIQEPRFWESIPRAVWIKVAEYMGERPPFLYPDIRPKKNRGGRPDYKQRITDTYEKLRDDGKINFDEPKARSYEKIKGMLNPEPSIKTVEKYVSSLLDDDRNATP